MCWQRGPCSQGTGSLRLSSCWLGCPEAPKPTSSSPVGGSTLLFLTSVEENKAQKPEGRTEPKAHGHACSEEPHGLQGRQPSHPQPRMGGVAPGTILQPYRYGWGRGVGAESWILQGLTKGLGSWASISHPWPPTLVT